jgi:hypothetical protein
MVNFLRRTTWVLDQAGLREVDKAMAEVTRQQIS